VLLLTARNPVWRKALGKGLASALGEGDGRAYVALLAETLQQPEVDFAKLADALVERGAKGDSRPHALRLAMQLAQGVGDTEKTEKIARLWVKDDPEGAESRQMMAEALIRSKKYEEVVEGYLDAPDKSLGLYQSVVGALMEMDRGSEAVALALEAMEKYRKEPLAHRILAYAYNKDGQRDKAVGILSVAPRDYQNQKLRAALLFEQKEYRVARQIYEELVVERWRDRAIWQQLRLLLTVTRFGGDRPDDYLKLIGAAISPERGPRIAAFHAWLLVERASLLDNLGRDKEALADYRAILEITPDDWRTLNNAAWILAQREEDLDEALDFAKRALALYPKPDGDGYVAAHMASLHDTLAEVREARKEWTEALNSATTASGLIEESRKSKERSYQHESEGKYLQRRGELLIRLDRKDEAFEIVKSILIDHRKTRASEWARGQWPALTGRPFPRQGIDVEDRDMPRLMPK